MVAVTSGRQLNLAHDPYLIRDRADMDSAYTEHDTELIEHAAVPPRPLVAAQRIWILISAISIVGALSAVLVQPDVLEWILLVGTALQATIAIPAAVAVARGRNWARRTLTVLAGISVASLYQSLQHHAWASLATNLVLAATLGLLQNKDAKAFCQPPRRDGQALH